MSIQQSAVVNEMHNLATFPERQIAVQEDANFGALLRWRLEVGSVVAGLRRPEVAGCERGGNPGG